MTIDPIRAKALGDIPHGFLGRRGGVSTGAYASLNVGIGSDDDPAAIAENRLRATEAVLPGARLVGLYQVHSADAVTVIEPFDDAIRPHADALVTNRPGRALGGVTDSTILAMEAIGAHRDRIVAAVGPCIARASYEVDDAFIRRFCEADPENERFFADGRAIENRGGHYQFDLEAYVVSRLAVAGIGRIEALGLDTYTDDDRFFSYRRATHRGEPSYGRQISIIGL